MSEGNDNTSQPDSAPEYELDTEAFEEYLATVQSQQSMVGGLCGGLAGALIGAAGWALVTVATNTGFGLVAVDVGLLAGYGVRLGGRGIERTFGILGAALALVGCAAGKLLTLAILITNQGDLSLAQVFVLMVTNPAEVGNALAKTFHPLDLLFYAIALYFGSVGVRNTRYTVACGLIADLTAVIAGILIAYVFFG